MQQSNSDFQDKEHTLVRHPNKSSKGSTPYKHTNPSTLQRLKEIAKKHKPSSAFELVDVKMGGMVAGISGRLPCSKRQCSDVWKRLFATERGDDLAVMMERCSVWRNVRCHLSGQYVLAAPCKAFVCSSHMQTHSSSSYSCAALTLAISV